MVQSGVYSKGYNRVCCSKLFKLLTLIIFKATVKTIAGVGEQDLLLQMNEAPVEIYLYKYIF